MCIRDRIDTFGDQIVEETMPNQVEEDSDDMIDTFGDQSAEDTMSYQMDGDYDPVLSGFGDQLGNMFASSYNN